MQDFKDKVVVITGAGSGIGRALALRFAREGARLALSDIDAGTLQQTIDLLPPGTPGRGYTLDVASRAAVLVHADDVQRDFGAAHVVVNNAGVSIIGTVEHLSLDEIEWLLGINLWGVIHGTKAFLPGMLARREGVIVNLSSVFGFIAVPGQSAYNIAKFGVRAFNECLWQELRDTGVRVVSVHPGGIATDIARKARVTAAAGEFERQMVAMSGQSLLTPPDDLAAAIIDGIRRGKQRVVAGHMSRFAWWLPRLLPDRYGSVLAWLVERRRAA
jgi:NAD(P)-dependent dehydrogenase (short-subunit alcohol dehydrogenase family)